MKTIIIKTQAEYDALPKAFDVVTVIKLRSSNTFWLQIKTVPVNGIVKVLNNSMVYACDNSTVSALDNSTVHAYNDSKLIDYREKPEPEPIKNYTKQTQALLESVDPLVPLGGLNAPESQGN
jgi:hypothetical protein